MPEKIPGGAFGLLILGAVNRLKKDAYGAKISKLLSENGREAPTPRVYQNLSQLEEAGFLTSLVRLDDGPRVRGKPARVYTLSSSAKFIIHFIADTG